MPVQPLRSLSLEPAPEAPWREATYVSSLRRRALRLGAILAAGSLLLVGPSACTLTQPFTWKRTPTTVQAADPARLKGDVAWVVEAFPGRSFDQPQTLDLLAEALAARLRAAGGRVSLQAFRVGEHTYRNVGARFGPEAGARVVVGAHYDAYHGLPAADDNASGVAGLLELARLLGERPPAGPVELVAYTLEEPPFFRTQDMGSARHAEALKQVGTRIRAMVSLEMIGYFSDEPGSQRMPVPLVDLLYPGRGNFIAVVGDLGALGLVRQVKGAMRGAAALEVRSMNAPRGVPGIDFSDHHPYWDRGFPAVMVTDGAFFRNRAYHTLQDTPERLDPVRMAQVVTGVRAVVDALCEP